MEDFEFLPDHGPIPEELWSDYLEAPFQECTVCGRPLDDVLYEIQKVSNGRETILEIACCFHCSQALASEYSRESMEAIRNFLASRLDLDRGEGLCNLCGEPFSRAPTVSVWGLSSRGNLLLPVIHVCGFCEEAMQELLSEKTRKARDDFINRTFPGVPADLDLAPTVFF